MIEAVQAGQISNITALLQSREMIGTEKTEKGSFGTMLTDLIQDVDNKQKAADLSIKQLAAGENISVQEIVMKLEEADITFQLMKEIRDKLVSAYKEIMSMQS